MRPTMPWRVATASNLDTELLVWLGDLLRSAPRSREGLPIVNLFLGCDVKDTAEQWVFVKGFFPRLARGKLTFNGCVAAGDGGSAVCI